MFLKPGCNCTIFLVVLQAGKRHPSTKWVTELKDDDASSDNDASDDGDPIDDENNAIADDGHDYLDCSKPVELKTCIVVALSSWTYQINFLIFFPGNNYLSDEMLLDRLVWLAFFFSGMQIKALGVLGGRKGGKGKT